MSSDPLLVGIDLGTTGSRCMIFDLRGQCVASAYREYPLNFIRPGWTEQSLPDMLEATADACREAVDAVEPDAIASVGLSTQQCATCPTDASGEQLRPMISWQDVRADAQTQALAEQITPERFRAIVGGPITPQWVIGKILWLRDNEPEIYERAEKWPQVQDLALRFLGAEGFSVDNTQAFFYGMWDVSNLKWSDEMLGLAGLDASHFGDVVPAGTQVGVVSSDAAARTGLPAGTPLCVGAGDQACGVVGMGATTPGIAAITLGTAGMLTLGTQTPRTELEEFFTINHPVPGQWALQAPTLAAASSYRWFRDTFGQPERAAAERDGANAFELLNELAAQAPPGSGGLIFMPFLNTAGSPHWNAEARGAFLGFLQSHERAHFARAVMEGVALETYDNLNSLTGHGLTPERLRLGGGATHSTLWNHIQADTYGTPVELLEESESTALGAAILGGVGAGVFTDIADGVNAAVRVRETIDPDLTNHQRYAETYAAYVDAYQSLAVSTFGRITALQSGEKGYD
jgi:xylulokinase